MGMSSDFFPTTDLGTLKFPEGWSVSTSAGLYKKSQADGEADKCLTARSGSHNIFVSGICSQEDILDSR